ncbi:MAG: type II toxin-antitoxin system RelE/ParE family toxin [Schwartzia sp.]|nr:type II toxin-antitoxin system RelE/ParE family toxin [Schwartzia sp. (in: firmicutes)]
MSPEFFLEFASDITRVFYFTFKGDTFVLLHGFKKKTNKTPNSELERALKYKKDFERRNSDEQGKR